MKKLIVLLSILISTYCCSGQNITDSLVQSTYAMRLTICDGCFDEPVSAFPLAAGIVSCLLIGMVIFVCGYEFITNKVLKNKQ